MQTVMKLYQTPLLRNSLLIGGSAAVFLLSSVFALWMSIELLSLLFSIDT